MRVVPSRVGNSVSVSETSALRSWRRAAALETVSAEEGENGDGIPRILTSILRRELKSIVIGMAVAQSMPGRLGCSRQTSETLSESCPNNQKHRCIAQMRHLRTPRPLPKCGVDSNQDWCGISTQLLMPDILQLLD